MFGVKLLWWFCLFIGARSLKIINIDVPSMIVLDDHSSRAILLNCSYDLEEDNTSLVVKWYKDGETVYQWIRGNPPTVFERFKDLVDDSYETSPDLSYKYSGLALRNLTINSTGTYKCVIQATSESAMEQKRMQVIDVSQHKLNIRQIKNTNDTYIECTVLNVYPKPSMTLSNGETTENIGDISTSTTILEGANGFFNGTTTAYVSENSNLIESYNCVIDFTGYNFSLTTNAYSSSVRNLFSKFLLIFVFLLF